MRKFLGKVDFLESWNRSNRTWCWKFVRTSLDFVGKAPKMFVRHSFIIISTKKMNIRMTCHRYLAEPWEKTDHSSQNANFWHIYVNPGINREDMLKWGLRIFDGVSHSVGLTLVPEGNCSRRMVWTSNFNRLPVKCPFVIKFIVKMMLKCAENIQISTKKYSLMLPQC